MILGRESEQSELSKAVASARTGDGGTSVIVGDPGMGKTTLLDWSAKEATGMTVLRARGRESEATFPFVALADLLRPLEHRISQLPAPQASALGSALALVEARPRDRLGVSAAVVRLLTDAALERPLVLVVDDFHWLDSPTADVIEFVARRAETIGIGLILASRNPGPHDHRGIELDLGPLPLDVALAVVGIERHVHPEVARRLVHLAAGNPLALVELPKGLTDEQLDGSARFDEPSSRSSAIEGMFRAQIDGLPAASNVAMLCVVEDQTGDLDVIERSVKSLGGTREDLDYVAIAGLILLDDGGSVEFRHPLVRSVARLSADPVLLRKVNSALADNLEDGDRKAWHLAAATARTDEDVAAGLETVGDRALARGGAGAAAAAYEKSAQLSPDPAARSRRFANAARAAHRAGNITLTASLIDAARLDQSSDIASLLLLDADIRMRRGDFAGAYGALRLEAARISKTDPGHASTMLLLAAKMRVYRFEAAEAVAEVEEALALLPESHHEVVHLAALAMAHTMAGTPGALAITLRAANEAVASPYGHIHSLGIGWPLVWLEQYEVARAFLTRSVSIQRDGGYLAYLPQALLALAQLEYRTGHWDLARAYASDSIRLFVEDEQPTEAAVASALLAHIEAGSGDEDSARRHARFAQESDIRSGLKAATAYSEAALGFLDLGLGRHDEAIVHLEHARTLVERGRIGEPWMIPLHADLAEARARIGDRDGAGKVASELMLYGETTGRASAIAAAYRCLGLVSDEPAFRTCFERAVAIHEGLPVPFELARTELAYGEQLRRQRKRVESRRRLRRALAIFETIGADPWVARARAELAASGETQDVPRSIATLTRQERQVASIVAGGATNRETATALFVNPKTIEFHLGNVYRKLGVRSRTELAIALRDGLNGDRPPADHR